MRRQVAAAWVVAVTAVAASTMVVGPAARLRAQSEAAPVRTIEVTASKYKFEPARIEVNEGETVRIVLHSTDTTHGFEIPEFKVKTLVPKGTEPVTVEFVADRLGAFPFKCSHFCGLGHHKMKGVLIVSPRSQR